MVTLPKIELKEERDELIKFMCKPYRRYRGYENTKEVLTNFVEKWVTKMYWIAWL